MNLDDFRNADGEWLRNDDGSWDWAEVLGVTAVIGHLFNFLILVPVLALAT